MSNRILPVLSILLVLLVPACLTAQITPRFERIGPERNFYQNITYGVAQDTTGNLWVATEEGIVRYNGLRAVTYTPDRGLPATFGTSIRCLTIASNGELYIGSDTGLARYDARADRFLDVPTAGPTRPNLIRALEITEDGDLIVAAFNGCWRVNPKSGRAQRLLDVRKVLALSLSNGNVYCGAATGVYIVHLKDDSYEHLPPPAEGQPSVISLTETGSALLVGSRNRGVYKIDNGSYTARYTITDAPVRDLLSTGPDAFYAATDGQGVYKISDGEVTDHYFEDVNDPASIASDGIYDLMLGRDSVLWLATYGGGLNRLDPHTNAFRHLRHRVNSGEGLSHPFVRAVLQAPGGDVWFGTKDGISIWTEATDKWQHLLTGGAGETHIVTALAARGNTVYAGTFQGELYAIDRGTLSLRQVPFLNDDELSSAGIFALAAPPRGGLWVGGINMSTYYVEEGEVTAYPIAQVRDIAVAPGGEVWLAAHNQVYSLEVTSGDKPAARAAVRPLPGLDAFRERRGVQKFNDLYAAGDGSLYIATNNAGLVHYDPKQALFRTLDTEDGLPTNSIQSIVVDAKRNIWAGTLRGLARISIAAADTTVRVFTETDGLLSTEFIDRSVAHLADGRLLFGSGKGATLFDPTVVGRSTRAPEVAFEELLLFNEPQPTGSPSLPSSLNTIDELALDYDQSAVTLGFTGISQAASGNLLYRWRMEGLTDKWSEPMTLSQVNFTNLEPGDYTFAVQAATPGGEWGASRNLPISVRPPWWRTWWAAVGYVFMFALAAYFGFRYIRAQVRRRNAERQIDFFNNITHELKTPLAILLASLDEATEEDGQSAAVANRKIRKTTKRLTALFDQLLNFHKASSTGKSRHVAAFQPGDRARSLTERFDPLLTERQLRLTVHDAAAPEVFHYDKSIFDKIVFNLVSNAVKYSRAGGHIEVSITGAREQLELRVRDDGIGIPTDQQKYILKEYYRARNAVNSQLPGTGLGLMMVKSMIEKEGGSIRFESEEDRGTTFFVRLQDRVADFARAQVLSTVEIEQSPEPAADAANHILLVEDNDELRDSLSGRLRQHFRVTTARNGREGLEKASEVFPDLILTDLIMPEMDGMELSRAIQADFQLDHIPIYLMTVLHNSNQKVESIAAGVSEYLEKPINFDLLLAKINNTLNWRKRMRERYAAQDEAEQAALHRSERENVFIEQLETFTRRKLSDATLSVQDLCQEMGMSRTSLYMKMKNLIDLNPQDFIIHTRLTEARRMLSETDEAVKSVAYDCGFSNPKYFSTAFKKKFGVSPSGFRKGLVG